LVVGATTVVNAESSRGFNGVKKPLVTREILADFGGRNQIAITGGDRIPSGEA
jgi:long-subunit acyl-CoA synthetase (AMP-forming)